MEQIKQMTEDLMKIVDGRTINLTTNEMKKIVDALDRTIEFIETSEELKELPEEIIDGMKQEYKDLGKKISTVLEEQLQILKEGRKEISEKYKNLNNG